VGGQTVRLEKIMKRDINDRLEEITELYNFRLFHLADRKVDILYEDYIQDRVKMNENQIEWLFNLIDRISIAIYG
jgi:hypothetical protein